MNDQNLAEATRRDYRKCADFLEPIRDTPIDVIDTPLIAGIHDKAAKKFGWRRANMVRTLLSDVFRYSIPKGLISAGLAQNVVPKSTARATAPMRTAAGPSRNETLSWGRPGLMFEWRLL